MQNANDVIDHLAAKLSVPAAHLWAVLVRQAQAEAIANVVIIAFFVVLIAVIALNARRYLKWYEDTDTEAAKVTWAFGIAIALIASLAGTITILVLSYQTILYFVNPEYYAVSKILAALGSK